MFLKLDAGSAECKCGKMAAANWMKTTALLEKGHSFVLDLVLFWSGFGINLESILVSVWTLMSIWFWRAFGHVLDSDRFQFVFGFNLDWDW